MSFINSIEKAVKKNNSLLCIGLDTDVQKLPPHLLDKNDPVFAFNREIIDKTADLVCCYKPNTAFYEAQGIDGIRSLKKSIDYIHSNYQDIPVILDAKRGDIGNTDAYNAKAAFEVYEADAVTVNPYQGFDSIEPFLAYKEKGVIVLCRTSNPGAMDFQDLKVKNMKLYEYVAKTVVRWNRENSNCLLVVGATWPSQMKSIRKVAKKMWMLVPGMGSQGGDLEKTLEYGLLKDGAGLILNASRSIIYAGKQEDFAEKARSEAIKMRDKINRFR